VGSKDRWKNLALLAATLIFIVLVTEVALRLLWRNGQYAVRIYQSAPYLIETKYWKAWHYPNARVHFVKDCLDVSYSTNSFGMRGRDIDRSGGGIALLGDSYVEGYAVNDGETIGSCLENLLDHRHPVMNFGVSGGFGTVHEVALYQNYARYFQPGCVVLFFVNYNDLYDNVNGASEGLIDSSLELTYPVAAGFDEIRAELARQSSKVPASESKHTPYLFRFLSQSLRVIGQSVQYWWNIRTDFSDALINVYMEPEAEAVGKGWIVTRNSLARLKQLTEEARSQLLVVDLADPYQIDANWLKVAALRSAKGKTLNPTHPNERLREICASLLIPYYDMYSDVMSYVTARRMRFPYLSFACDRHFNKEGNSLVARLVAQQLQARFGVN